MEPKQWERQLDRVADSVSEAVTEGVHALENVFDKGRDRLKDDPGAPHAGTGAEATGSTSKGSPRLGLTLVGLGIVWLLHSLGILQQPVFPILLIVLGVYFIVRAK